MPIARNSDLEEQLRARPDDEQLWLVYADWLQGQGDPRGELIALNVARAGGLEPARESELSREVSNLVARHRDELLGSAARFDRWIHMKWRYGFIEQMRVHVASSAALLIEVTRELVRSPVAPWVEGLTLVGPADEPLQPCLDEVVRAAAETELSLGELEMLAVMPAARRRLNLLEVSTRGPRDRGRGQRGAKPERLVSSLADIGRLERLRALRLNGPGIDVGPGPVEHPRLRELSLRGSRLEPVCLSNLAVASLPELRHLELTLSSPMLRLEHVVALIHTLSVDSLVLHHPRLLTELMEALPSIDPVQKLKTLVVTGIPPRAEPAFQTLARRLPTVDVRRSVRS